MENLFVKYEIASKLKEIGFTLNHEQVLKYYNIVRDLKDWSIVGDDETILYAPTYQQVIDWFRDKHKLEIVLHPKSDDIYAYDIFFNDQVEDVTYKGMYNAYHTQYYECWEKAIDFAIRLIKNKTK